MTTPVFDLLVFDWDGTLMDSTAHIVRSIQRACASLDLPVPDHRSAAYVIGLGLTDAMRHVSPGLPEARYADMVDAYRRFFFDPEDDVQLFAGVADALCHYREQGYFLAIATGKSRPGLDRVLEQTGIAGLFDATRTVNECASKPDPQMLDELTRYFGVDAGRTLMVGDTTHDLLMAQNARVPAAGLAQGAHPQEALAALSPLKLFSGFGEFDGWLRQLPR
ncbi:HAD-IA family hydrolase [Laribacter hongkongensis]|uniref:HAD-IA family hydrolase n=1 Tax=Laribacter hongkongensis TaxID=168471 RepID=UPI001EFE6EA8|nr:HAD-IA family hydrolase [Laribacter hongkongensis]MCG8991035.1 HAD-IA family hydrolase [Laribacter hongkongensis]MCG8996896.1 HAD-IA family hydrolase [Laribacter hongkongensis]MCG9001046.1 HAD-IA family hydrolase [Laribacter hongkongensis]MCG9004755.1 HAD-IA family hydrolase [Laribacter hongkongensis]MCG9006087.1 HAD-IA family hydrolase [Laribacter hongkongensis]